MTQKTSFLFRQTSVTGVLGNLLNFYTFFPFYVFSLFLLLVRAFEKKQMNNSFVLCKMLKALDPCCKKNEIIRHNLEMYQITGLNAR
jgi:hypothetical protein